MLKKDFIRFNNFDCAIFVLIIKKFEKKLRICVDYKIFNVLIIKNNNILFLIKKNFYKIMCNQNMQQIQYYRNI